MLPTIIAVVFFGVGIPILDTVKVNELEKQKQIEIEFLEDSENFEPYEEGEEL